MIKLSECTENSAHGFMLKFGSLMSCQLKVLYYFAEGKNTHTGINKRNRYSLKENKPPTSPFGSNDILQAPEFFLSVESINLI